MTLCDRLIGGAVNLVAKGFDLAAPFWQTPREVEWAKAAADGESALRWIEGSAGGSYAIVQPDTSAPTPGAVDGPAEGDAPRPPSAVVGDGVSVGGQLGGWLAGLTERVDKAGEENALYCCYLPDVMQPCGPCRTGDGDCTLLSTPSVESPAPEFDWVTAAIPVIAGVLAEHFGDQRFARVSLSPHIRCFRRDGSICGEFADWQDWRSHVAPHIAAALQTRYGATVHHISGDRPRPLSDSPKHRK